jgi:hypothetical protein
MLDMIRPPGIDGGIKQVLNELVLAERLRWVCSAHAGF